MTKFKNFNRRAGVVTLLVIIGLSAGGVVVLTPVAAQESSGEMSVEVSQINGEKESDFENVAPLGPGDDVTFDVIYDSPPDIDPASVEFAVGFDQSVLNLIEVSQGGYLSADGTDTGLVEKESDGGVLTYGRYRRSGDGRKADSGTVASIKFKVKGDFSGQTESEISIIESNTKILHYKGVDNPVEAPTPSGNSGKVVIDTVPPDISGVSVESDTDPTNGKITVNANTVDDATSSVDSIGVGVQSTDGDHTYSRKLRTDEDIQNGVQINVSNVTEDRLDGPEIADDYTGYVNATDISGNLAEETGGDVSIDTKPPQVKASMSGLGSSEATLQLEVEEDTSYDINTVEVDGNSLSGPTEDLTAADQEFTFDGSTTKDEATFNSTIVVTDAVGNREKIQPSSTLISYDVEDDGTATITPDKVDTEIELEATNTNTSANATITESESPPSGTDAPGAETVGSYVNVEDIGVTVETATVEVPVDQDTPNDTLSIYYASGGTEFSPEGVDRTGIEKKNGKKYIIGQVNGFSTFVAGKNTAPEIDSLDIIESQPLDAATGGTAVVKYSDDEDNIADVSATPGSIENTRSDQATIELTDLTPGEKFDLSVEVEDEGGKTASKTLSAIEVEDNSINEESNTGEGPSGGSGGGGGGGGGGPGGGSEPAAGDSGPPSFPEIKSTLSLVDPVTDTEAAIETSSDQSGAMVTPVESESVNTINFNDDSVEGTVSITGYDEPPQTIANDITESAAADLDDGSEGEASPEASNEDADIDVVSLTDISPTGEAEDSAAVVELTVDRSRVSDPGQLSVIKETYSFEQQKRVWKRPETSIKQTTEQAVTLEVEVDEFSLFAIIEEPQEKDGSGTDEAAISSGDTSEDGDGFKFEQPLLLIGAGVVFALLIAGSLSRMLRDNSGSTAESTQPSQQSGEDTTMKNGTDDTTVSKDEFEWDSSDDP